MKVETARRMTAELNRIACDTPFARLCAVYYFQDKNGVVLAFYTNFQNEFIPIDSRGIKTAWKLAYSAIRGYARERRLTFLSME